jgi:DNA-binding response OmpR family regulator
VHQPNPDRRLTVLFVEDHFDTLQGIIVILTMQGHHVLPARNCTEAVALAKAFEIDLLIADVQLPDGNGWELLAAVREFRPNLPGIALTAHAFPEHIARSKEAGYCEHVIKPPLGDELDRAIERCRRGKS